MNVARREATIQCEGREGHVEGMWWREEKQQNSEEVYICEGMEGILREYSVKHQRRLSSFENCLGVFWMTGE